MITGAAMLAALVGRPVRQSLSPLIHNAWIAAAGLDAVYVPIELAEDSFEGFVAAARGGNIRGVNVTMPFKERAFALADRRDAAAESAGAANLLLFGDTLEARNTDGAGLLEALARQAPQLTLDGARVVLLGAGGGAQGAAAALLAAGVATLQVVNRTPDRAEALAGRLGPNARALAWDHLPDALAGADLVVNATSAGMGGASPLELPWDGAPDAAVAMDMVYKPLETAFLAGARRRGLAVVDGLEMLIGQARPTFAALFGRPAPEEVDVRALALKALGEPA